MWPIKGKEQLVFQELSPGEGGRGGTRLERSIHTAFKEVSDIIGNGPLPTVWQGWSQEKPVRNSVVIQMRDDTGTSKWQWPQRSRWIWVEKYWGP